MDYDSITKFVRWLFTYLILSFLAIIISGKILTQLAPFKMSIIKGKQEINFLTGIINIKATGDEVIIGLGGFISVLTIVGLTMGEHVQKLLKSSFGLSLEQFEAICIISSFLLLLISFLTKVLFGKTINTQVKYDREYTELIEDLSKKNK